LHLGVNNRNITLSINFYIKVLNFRPFYSYSSSDHEATLLEVGVDLLNGATEASISERKVVDEGMGPVLSSGIVHDLFKARVDDVDLRSTRQFSHVGRGSRNGVAHHVE
jgi:hypothetical protein